MTTRLSTLTLAAIQGRLMMIRGESVFAESVRQGAIKDLKGCITMIKDQSKSNRDLVEKIIGKGILVQIESL